MPEVHVNTCAMAKTSEVVFASLLLILAQGSSSLSCVMMENFYPFGLAAGDAEFDVDNSAAATLLLPVNVVFFGQSMGSIFVS